MDANEEYARTVIGRMQAALLAAMQARDWPVTLSIGVLVCPQLPDNIQAMIAMADELMYAAKQGGRNQAVYQRYSG